MTAAPDATPRATPRRPVAAPTAKASVPKAPPKSHRPTPAAARCATERPRSMVADMTRSTALTVSTRRSTVSHSAASLSA